jgi:flagellin-like hook-associated protein FlgL
VSIGLRTNIAAQNTLRWLGQSDRALSNNFDRLSSGLRITRPSDDAAGIAIGSALKSDVRVYSQGIRNVNDGISVLNIAEGALGQLSNIVTRQRELAEQAANGVYSGRQRMALQQEVNALVKEFNRIVRSTSFNGQNIISGRDNNYSVQQGYGSNETTAIALTQALGTAAGSTTSFFSGYSNSNYNSLSAVGDIDGDGNVDIVANKTDALGVVYFYRGNGDGTFLHPVQYALSDNNNINKISLADFNGDGRLDIITAQDSGRLSVLLANSGSATFRAPVSYAIAAGGASPIDIQIRDLNGDGVLDVVTADSISSSVSVLFGNSNGSFSSGRSFAVGAAPTAITIQDFNGDGIMDLAASTSSGFSILIGNSNGSYAARTQFSAGVTPDIIAYDFNGDGIQDLALGSDGNRIKIQLGNGDGTFRVSGSYVGGPDDNRSLVVNDFNGDGVMDLAFVFSGNSAAIMWGNSDGSFRARTFLWGQSTVGISTGDFNNDGIPDIVHNEAWDYLGVTMGVADTSGRRNPFQYDLDMLTAPAARQALITLASYQTRISNELGKVGAYQSRLATSLGNLNTRNLNYQEAASRILDVDIATESAAMVKNKILRDAGTAVLGQANQQPELVLTMLKNLSPG